MLWFALPSLVLIDTWSCEFRCELFNDSDPLRIRLEKLSKEFEGDNGCVVDVDGDDDDDDCGTMAVKEPETANVVAERGGVDVVNEVMLLAIDVVVDDERMLEFDSCTDDGCAAADAVGVVSLEDDVETCFCDDS
jgi:hypothetical protein